MWGWTGPAQYLCGGREMRGVNWSGDTWCCSLLPPPGHWSIVLHNTHSHHQIQLSPPNLPLSPTQAHAEWWQGSGKCRRHWDVNQAETQHWVELQTVASCWCSVVRLGSKIDESLTAQNINFLFLLIPQVIHFLIQSDQTLGTDGKNSLWMQSVSSDIYSQENCMMREWPSRVILCFLSGLSGDSGFHN